MWEFATAFIAIINTKQRIIEYAAAAAPPPLFLSAAASKTLESRGHLLGVDQSVTFENHRLNYQAGDMFLVYSDALVESFNASGATMQMEEVTMQMRAATLGAAECLRAVVADFYDRFTRQPDDDLSMILCVL